MRLPSVPLVLSVMGTLCSSEAFVARQVTRSPSASCPAPLSATQPLAGEDCGCAAVQMSGKPTDIARALNIRNVLGDYSVLSAEGGEIPMDDLVGNNVAIVVFLRSLG